MRLTFVAMLLVFSFAAMADESERMAELRRRMVITQLEARGIRDSATLAAMRTVPRHEFVPEDRRHQAYADRPLPIGYNQTISQPYIVAYMTELLGLEPGQRALEIGTGSGYQAAVLAEITDQVYTIEIIGQLAEFGQNNLRRSGYDQVQVKHADGYYGWPEHAPFDAIVVTAASPDIPAPLVEQLKDGGVMVIPVGHPFRTQQLMLVEKKNGEVRTRRLMAVRFVPFTRGQD